MNFEKCTMYLIFLILCGKLKINNFEKCTKYQEEIIHCDDFEIVGGDA